MAEEKAVAKVKKVTMNYDKLTMAEMTEWLNKNHSEGIEDFEANAYELKGKITLVPKILSNGKPDLYIDKNGKTKIRKVADESKTGEKVKKLNVFKAKKYFVETYKNEITFVRMNKSTKQLETMKI